AATRAHRRCCRWAHRGRRRRGRAHRRRGRRGARGGRGGGGGGGATRRRGGAGGGGGEQPPGGPTRADASVAALGGPYSTWRGGGAISGFSTGAGATSIGPGAFAAASANPASPS